MLVTNLIVSFLVCLIFCFLGVLASPYLGLLDMPQGRRQHDGPTPLVGGLALITTLLAVSRVRGLGLPFSRLELAAIISMALVGLVDDLLDLPARNKALLGLMISFLLAAGVMHRLPPGHPAFALLGFTVPPMAWLESGLLVLLFWCIPQGFNLIDGANGLATGFALVVVGSLWGAGMPHPMMAGALLACLSLNFPKARLFLGNCGSLSIGLILVIYAQKALLGSNPNSLLWIFAYPIIDVVMVITIRLIKGKPIYIGDRSHLHHQIRERWPSLAWLAMPLLLGISAMCGSEVYLTGPWVIVPNLGLVFLVAMSGLFTLMTLRAYRYESPQEIESMKEDLTNTEAK
jgi:UDP-GlcNAc:undecaprenyl-phosphate GlcNAc-1-phosphate transferase